MTSGSGSAPVDARLAGVIRGSTASSSRAGSASWNLAGTNTYAGGTSLAEGKLIGSSNSAFGTGPILVGTTSDTRTISPSLELEFRGNSLANTNSITFGSANLEGYSLLRLAADVDLNGTITINRLSGRNVIIETPLGTAVNPWTSMASSPVPVASRSWVAAWWISRRRTRSGRRPAPPVHAINGGTSIRDGTVKVSATTALSGTTVELGEPNNVKASVAYATNGASVLGVERSNPFTTSGRSGYGGSFIADGNGAIDGVGNPVAGPGAFYNVNRFIDDKEFTSADLGVRILVKDEIANPERNGIYQLVQVNADGTINLKRVADFDGYTTLTSTAANNTNNLTVASTAGLVVGQPLTGAGICLRFLHYRHYQRDSVYDQPERHHRELTVTIPGCRIALRNAGERHRRQQCQPDLLPGIT